ncbi:MAG: hypothetical protein K6T65_09035 [Peptococcaceae bacterium]|nr:hypothetical protein [Peptococcaceae bacterium]
MLLVVPGILFFMAAGKQSEMNSPSGWLMSLATGVVVAVITAIFFAMFGYDGIVRNILSNTNDIRDLYIYGFFVYLSAVFFGSAWRLFRIFGASRKIWLYAEKKFRYEGEFFVSRNLLEHLFFVCRAVNVNPEIKVVTSSHIYEGECIKYQWSQPSSLLLIENNEGQIGFIYINLSEVEAIYLKNWAQIKKARKVDEGEYLRFIGDDLPEKLKGKRDMCGNMWYYDD